MKLWHWALVGIAVGLILIAIVIGGKIWTDTKTPATTVTTVTTVAEETYEKFSTGWLDIDYVELKKGTGEHDYVEFKPGGKRRQLPTMVWEFKGGMTLIAPEGSTLTSPSKPEHGYLTLTVPAGAHFDPYLNGEGFLARYPFAHEEVDWNSDILMVVRIQPNKPLVLMEEDVQLRTKRFEPVCVLKVKNKKKKED